MILFTIYDLFTMNVYDRNGRKTPKYTKSEYKGKIPRLVALSSPVYENVGRLFSGVRKHRKQAGPTLGWRSGILA